MDERAIYHLDESPRRVRNDQKVKELEDLRTEFGKQIAEVDVELVGVMLEK